MSSMLRAIVQNSSTGEFVTNNDFHLFSDFQKSLLLMNQCLLCDYVLMFTSDFQGTFSDSVGPKMIREYRQDLLTEFYKLPHTVYTSGKYEEAYQMLRDMLTDFRYPDAADIMTLYMDQEVLEHPSLCSLDKNFVLPFLYAMTGTKLPKEMLADLEIDDTSSSDDGYNLLAPVLLTPVFKLMSDGDHYLLGANKQVNLESQYLILTFTPVKSFPSFTIDDFSSMSKSLPALYRYIAGFNWRNKSYAQFLAMMATFSIDHDHSASNYGMIDNDPCCSIVDVCYDIVTRSDFTTHVSSYDNLKSSFDKLLKYLCDRWKLNIDDYALLGDTLSKLGYATDAISYLQKNVNEITTAEMEAFQRSSLASFINRIALEANDPIVDDKISADKVASPVDNNVTPGDPTTDGAGDLPTEPGDPTLGDDSIEDSETKSEQIDDVMPDATDGVMLELLDPSKETLSDYLYRNTFLVKVNNILQNPTQFNCSKKELILLKQWASRWLYIMSVQSLKSFLKNLSFSLMPDQL